MVVNYLAGTYFTTFVSNILVLLIDFVMFEVTFKISAIVKIIFAKLPNYFFRNTV